MLWTNRLESGSSKCSSYHLPWSFSSLRLSSMLVTAVSSSYQATVKEKRTGPMYLQQSLNHLCIGESTNPFKTSTMNSKWVPDMQRCLSRLHLFIPVHIQMHILNSSKDLERLHLLFCLYTMDDNNKKLQVIRWTLTNIPFNFLEHGCWSFENAIKLYHKISNSQPFYFNTCNQT